MARRDFLNTSYGFLRIGATDTNDIWPVAYRWFVACGLGMVCGLWPMDDLWPVADGQDVACGPQMICGSVADKCR